MLKGNCQFEIKDNVLMVMAEAGTDYFVNPIDGHVVADAAFAYEEIEGDFICRAKVSLDHQSQFDAGALFAWEDAHHWVKLCFEQGDYGFRSVCTVVTDGLSDDSNGITVDGNEIWFQLARTKDVFSMHYSLDGQTYYMARLASRKFSKTLKVGFEGQSPTGHGGARYFTDFVILKRSLVNPRQGS